MGDLDITGQPMGISGRPAWLARRGIAGIRGIVAVGAAHGVDAATCLRGSGLAPEDLDSGAAVRGAQELTVAANLVRACPEPGLGVEVGERLRLRHYGVWGFALMACPTLRDAARVGLERLELTYATAAISMRVVGPEVRLEVDDADVPAPARDFVVERELTAMRGIIGTILGEPLPLLRVDLRRGAAGRGRPAEPGVGAAGGRPAERCAPDLFPDVPVVFGAPRNALVARASLLDRPLPQADPRTMRVCARECDLLLRERLDRHVTECVRDLCRGGPTDMTAAAARLHLSPRTLRRKLAAEGTSYHRLVAEIRHARAVELLTTTRLGVEPIALRLGYTDASTFTRAFRRWTGTTPGSYRAGAR